jgi:5-methylcytosine-specific restriction endonuclease McrA
VSTLAEWSARVYGPGWEETKRRYWASPYTRKRCFWCRRKDRLQLNHLTYQFSGETGRVPLWVLKPLCRRCHVVETWLTKRVRRRLARHAKPWAHAVVTYGVRWSGNVSVWLLVLVSASKAGIL